MIKLNKKHDYLFCIDSDGTVMDTMTIKHVNCFGPKFIEVFSIKDHQQEILDHWNFVNLYSKQRGINRFQGLAEIIKFVEDSYNVALPYSNEFRDWVMTTNALSNDSLREEIKKVEHNICLKLALLWSYEVNYSQTLLPPFSAFEGVKECLEVMRKGSDLIGVSSANKEAVLKEWDRNDVSKYFDYIACQDEGSKLKIFEYSIVNGYKKNHVIVIGDSLKDLDSANRAGVMFYPIIPTKEVSCWNNLKDKVFDDIIKGKYDDNYQQNFVDEFNKVLK